MSYRLLNPAESIHRNVACMPRWTLPFQEYKGDPPAPQLNAQGRLFRRQERHEDTTRWDTIEFKLD